VLTSIVCVLLVLFVGAAQALHSHSAGEVTNPGCSLCAVSHVTAIAVPVPTIAVTAEAVSPVTPPDVVTVPNRFFYVSLYVRPPPALDSRA
jgi:hypothetical protein